MVLALSGAGNFPGSGVSRPYVRADQETHGVSPPAAPGLDFDRFNLSKQRPAPVSAGEKRPPWAGRALAVCFGHTASMRQLSRVAPAMAGTIAAVSGRRPGFRLKGLPAGDFFSSLLRPQQPRRQSVNLGPQHILQRRRAEPRQPFTKRCRVQRVRHLPKISHLIQLAREFPKRPG